MTRRILGAMAPVLLLGMAVACGDKEAVDTSDTGSSADGTDGTDGSDGATVFANTCAACHGADGDSGYAASLSDEVPGKSDADLEAVIQGGEGSMPAQNLSAADLAAVMTYLRATFP